VQHKASRVLEFLIAQAGYSSYALSLSYTFRRDAIFSEALLKSYATMIGVDDVANLTQTQKDEFDNKKFADLSFFTIYDKVTRYQNRNKSKRTRKRRNGDID
jgi:hypothetical protein